MSGETVEDESSVAKREVSDNSGTVVSTGIVVIFLQGYSSGSHT